MCYDFKVSIITYIIGIASAIFAFYTKQMVLGMLILFYSQIQLSEAVIWRGIDSNNNALNKTGTTMAKYLLATHNIGIALGILLTAYLSGQKDMPFIPLLISVLFFIWVCVVYYIPDVSPETTNIDPESKRLKWEFPHSWYIYSVIISIIFLIIYIKPIQTKIFVLGAYLLTLMWYYIRTPKVIGSMWCFAAAISAPLIVIGNYYLTRE